MSAQCLEMLLVCMLLLNSMNSEHINKSDAETLELLAEAAHKVWMEGKLRDGWKYGRVTDKAGKIHSCLVPY